MLPRGPPGRPATMHGLAPPPRGFDLGLPPFELEGGQRLPRLHLRGWAWGPASDGPVLDTVARPAPLGDRPVPAAPRSPSVVTAPSRLDPSVPTVLLVHALTGDARAGGPGGWWGPLIGPGRPLDPTRSRLLCFNNLGSCYGSFGPSYPDWPWVPGPQPRFGLGPPELPAAVTTWDQARAILRALDRLGIQRVRVATGGSLGAMIVLALGALAPERFEQLLPLAGSLAASPWIIGFNHVARQTILLDPDWPRGPERGLALARQLAQMTYRAEPGLTARQGRRMRTDFPDRSTTDRPTDDGSFAGQWSSHLPYAQETYLEHQGGKLVARFDAASYLVQLAAMDHHDVERAPPSPAGPDRYEVPHPWPGAGRIRSRVDAVGIDSDVLYPARHMRALVGDRPARRYHELSSLHGHDGFLIEWPQLDAILRASGAPFDGSSHD